MARNFTLPATNDTVFSDIFKFLLATFIFTNILSSASAQSGGLPQWLTHRKALNGIEYTTGSDITCDFAATNLSFRTYYTTVTASATAYNSGVPGNLICNPTII